MWPVFIWLRTWADSKFSWTSGSHKKQRISWVIERTISLATFGDSWPQHTDNVICHLSYKSWCRFPDPFHEANAIFVINEVRQAHICLIWPTHNGETHHSERKLHAFSNLTEWLVNWFKYIYLTAWWTNRPASHPTNYMKHGPSSEAKSSSASQSILFILWTPEAHCHDHNSLPCISTMIITACHVSLPWS